MSPQSLPNRSWQLLAWKEYVRPSGYVAVGETASPAVLPFLAITRCDECPDLVFNFVKQISKDFPEKFSDVVRSDALRVLLGHELYVSYINPHLQNCVLHVELKIV
ncbi:hypothetical protein pipiens_014596 [Culex pipiens pipiens]|uniref:Uncharacterized protein n=1 Tax=Culex pipiens pipiens TaxID=38569 RepID=A0ABD1CTW5_CULPP